MGIIHNEGGKAIGNIVCLTHLQGRSFNDVGMFPPRMEIGAGSLNFLLAGRDAELQNLTRNLQVYHQTCFSGSVVGTSSISIQTYS